MYLGKYGSTHIKLPISHCCYVTKDQSITVPPQYQQFLAINSFKLSNHNINTLVQVRLTSF